MRVALVAGPGGSGVSTIAALTAVAAARSGSRTVLVSSDTSMPQILGREQRPGLTLLKPDPAAELVAGWPLVIGWLPTLIADEELAGIEVAGLPGAADVATLITIAAVARSGKCDDLVIDAGSDAAALIAAPEIVGRLIDVLMPTPKRILHSFTHLLGGRRSPDSAESTPDPIGALLDRLLMARAILTESIGAALHLVTDPRPLRVAAAAAMVPVLAMNGVGLGRVIYNQMIDGSAPKDPPAGWPAELLTVPRESTEPTGIALDNLAGTVFGDRDPLQVTAGPAVIDLQVGRVGDSFEVLIPLPLVDRRALQLSRSGTDLLLTIHNSTRRVELPSVLRRCRVVEAELADDALRIAFVPDPAQWPEALQLDGDPRSAAAESATGSESEGTR